MALVDDARRTVSAVWYSGAAMPIGLASAAAGMQEGRTPHRCVRFWAFTSSPAPPPSRRCDVVRRTACAAFRAFCASTSRLRGGAFVWSDAISRFRRTAVTSSTAMSNAASSPFDGRVAPLSLRTLKGGRRISSSRRGVEVRERLDGCAHGGESLGGSCDLSGGGVRPGARGGQGRQCCLTLDPTMALSLAELTGVRSAHKAFDIADSRDVIEHDVAFPAVGKPPGLLSSSSSSVYDA